MYLFFGGPFKSPFNHFIQPKTLLCGLPQGCTLLNLLALYLHMNVRETERNFSMLWSTISWEGVDNFKI